MAIAPSGLIGLVIHGGAEAYTQGMVPFGKHKEYGYWRSNYHKPVRSNFDILDLRIQNDPDITGSRKITTSSLSQCNGVGLPNTLELSLDEATLDCICLQEADSNPSVTYDAASSTADNASWINNNAYDPTNCSSAAADVTARFFSDGTTIKLTIDGCASSATYAVDSVNEDCTEFTFNSVDLSGCCGGGDETGNLFKVIADSTSTPGTDGLLDESTGRTFTIAGSGLVQKAGTQKEAFGDESPQERVLYLPENSYVITDSGRKSVTNGFTLFASFVPDGDNAGKVIASKFKEQTATFVLGTDDLGKIYVRADKIEDGENKQFIARSQKPYHQYDYPIQTVAVKGTGVVGGGEGGLKLYINSNLESTTSDFTRTSPVARESDKIWIGRTERRVGQGDFKGWINEIGVASTPFSSGDIKKLHYDRKELTNYLQEATAIYSSGGGFDNNFSDAFNIKDDTYVQFTVESGGGAFDTDLWGLGNFAVSSVASFPLSNVDSNFWQLSPEPSGIEVVLWVKHDTSHSGCYLTTSISKEPSVKGVTDLRWDSGAYVIASGTPAKKIEADGSLTTIPESGYVGGAGIQKITMQGLFQKNWGFNDFDDTNELNLSGKESLKKSIDEHNLNISLYYPAATGDGAFNAEFKIYKAKVNARSFRTFNAWANDRTLYTTGAIATASSGIADLYLEAKEATQSMDLYLHMAKGSSMFSRAALSGAPTMSQGSGISLYVESNIPNTEMNLFLKAQTPTSLNNNQNLFLYAANNPFLSGQYDSLKLYLEARDDGTRNASMNMVFPNVAPGKFNRSRLLYTKGIAPHMSNSTDLFLWNAQSGINNSQELYLEAVESLKASGSMNMVIDARTPGRTWDSLGGAPTQFVGSSRMGSTATVVGNSGMALYMYGKETISPILTKATATLEFSATDWNAANQQTLSLTDINGVNKTYTIKNDASAVASNGEFNAGASRSVAATNLVNLINSSNGHNGSITAIDSGNGLVVLHQAGTGHGGHTEIVRSPGWNSLTSIDAPTTFVGGISRGIKQNATARFVFHPTDYNSVNDGTVTITDSYGYTITYIVKNDGTAHVCDNEFEAGGGATLAQTAAGFAEVVENVCCHQGKIHATDSAGVRWSSGGYDFSDGVVILKQVAQGNRGETTITTDGNFNDILTGNAPARFTDGLNAGMSLVMPNTIGSGINNTMLYIKGYE